ncbi:MAG: hypothetical protein IJ329_00190 [Clostridia bacterium]|nr:hypothetical protein [Clostridia bacterium]
MKTKKWVAVALSVCMCASFAACGESSGDDSGNDSGNGGGNAHTHAYTVQNTTQTYLKSAADCTNPAQYYYACECGEKGTETYTYGEASGHDYTDGVCGVCTEPCLHTETQWETDVTAGCLTDGTKNSVCVECGEILGGGSVEATGHTFVNGTCKDCGADLWDGTADVSWYTGDKSEYFIYTAEQLAGVSKLSAEGTTFENVTLTLSAGIALDEKEWTPIGTDTTNWFMGTFNGNGLSISNMKITTPQERVGLFGYVAPQGTIKGFTLYNVDINIDSGYCCVGGLAGSCSGTVENCGVTGKISVGASISTKYEFGYVGGAFGTVYNATNVFADCEVQNVYSDVPTQVDVTRRIGGFAGSITGATNCYSLGNVTYDCQADIDYGTNNVPQAWALVGGFAGLSTGARNCYAAGDVIAKGTFWSYIGGFSGEFYNSALSCYATGDVTVNSVDNNLAGGYTGGLIGYITEYDDGGITYCYATGDVNVNVKGSHDAGGLIGRDGATGTTSVSDSYATGNVTLVGGRQSAAGGLIGRNLTAKTEKSYATGNVTITNTDATATTNDYMIICEAGGLMGKTSGSVENCYASGSVNATSYTDAEARVYAYVGGLIGYVQDDARSESKPTVTVLNTYAIGDVSLTMPSTSGTDHPYAGGLIGYLNYAQLSRSFASNDVTYTRNKSGSGGGAKAFVAYNANGGANADERTFQCYAESGRKVINVLDGVTTEKNSEDSWTYGGNPTYVTLESLQKVSLIKDTIMWSTEIWNMADGEYPTLYWNEI